ncbi:DUF2946 family protein [Trinickia caryophylli]|uniref:DUF2946 family protein n=1 Tax=Trinickia caryophylli TaxID=28094 RepID=A0A1X7EVN5_TRICW|nr:DUF2946 family protein [Trinickia caryophylli]PMS09710.1 DUF2946 domain-containing protein [Trinickia caryophylli]TRX18480.1 DUF2946 family protein [Trinickia caryophylli]WQE10731.1 DUF2946 family protein [Trinickia caryophylli]SMF41129.1 Protein of unknown function [Trinickia caryophylli]
MDDIVKAALAKWPNVPHCRGWLLLDRRGQWRMRDEGVQLRGELGTPVRHAALIGFINRNYERDETGQWFFQNGPQRVYVELAYTPWIVRLSVHDEPRYPAHLFLTDHTGSPFEPAMAFVDETGAVLFADTSQPARLALLHDHDLGLFADHATLDDDGQSGCLQWRPDRSLPVESASSTELPALFAFVQSPAAAIGRC